VEFGRQGVGLGRAGRSGQAAQQLVGFVVVAADMRWAC
jgi:hypothetical protein